MDEKKLEIMNKGKMAEIVFTHFNELIENKKSTLLKQLKTCARQGQHDLVLYTGIMYAVNALEDIQDGIKRDIKSAYSVEGEILNGNK